jgi:ABC-type nitrate/sulfonate/bicarbonate transport system permease component
LLRRPSIWSPTGGTGGGPLLQRLGIGAIGLAGLLLAWEVAAAIWNDSVILPSPIRTARTFVNYLSHPYPSNGVTLWQDLLISLRRIVSGFGAGTVAGIAIGAAMFNSRVLRHLIDPLIEATRPCPRWPSSHS